MNEKITQAVIDEAIKHLDKTTEIAGKLSINVWHILVNQAKVAATVASIEILGLFILKGLLIFAFIKYAKPTADGDRFPRAIAWVVSIIMITGLSIGTANLLPTALTGYMNPEFWAIQTILSTVGR